MFPAARLTGKFLCPLVTPGLPPIPHAAGGVLIEGDTTVLIGGLPAATLGSNGLCAGPPPHPVSVVKGSLTVLIGEKPAARMSDITSTGGMILVGEPTVLIGG